MKEMILEKILFGIKYIGFCFYIFGIPIALYLFAKWDPFVGFDEYGDVITLGLYPIIITYWILIFLAYKYNDERKRYKHALEKILRLDRLLFVEEKVEIWRKVLKDTQEGYKVYREGKTVAQSDK